MFPLGSVLFPHGYLPLQVFEPRYKVLTFDCLRGEREFGVVLIERGFEVGGGDERFGVGTVAHIVQAREVKDAGVYLLATIGTRRFRVSEWLEDDPYPRALVTELPDTELDELINGMALVRAEEVVRRVLRLKAEIGEPAVDPEVELDTDPGTRAWQLCAIAPLGSLDQVGILAIDDPGERLARLADAAEEEATVLAFRLGSE